MVSAIRRRGKNTGFVQPVFETLRFLLHGRQKELIPDGSLERLAVSGRRRSTISQAKGQGQGARYFSITFVYPCLVLLRGQSGHAGADLFCAQKQDKLGGTKHEKMD